MKWFRKQPASDPVVVDPAPVDLHAPVADLGRWINRNAGHLPAEAVVRARWILDTLLEAMETTDDKPPEVFAFLLIEGTVRDYLPTTLRTYLAIDESLREVPRLSGQTPSQSLLGQLEALQEAASRTLRAVRDHDADALSTQGNFLRTKFSGSDLDL